jgi:hypothetical protein
MPVVNKRKEMLRRLFNSPSLPSDLIWITFKVAIIFMSGSFAFGYFSNGQFGLAIFPTLFGIFAILTLMLQIDAIIGSAWPRFI